MRSRFNAAALVLLTACGASARDASPPATSAAQYLYLWTASADSTQPDFLAVLDVTTAPGDTARYGRLVTTLPVPGFGNHPHHTEHQFPIDSQLFANGFGTGQTFVFDLRHPDHPRIAAQFGDRDGYMHPHSFLRLPNGHVLATFQMQHGGSAHASPRPGGLVELTTNGEVVRSASAAAAGADTGLRVYSAAVIPSLDRVVSTTTDMEQDFPASRNLQLWRLSDLTLLSTFPLPDGATGGEALLTAEPRLLGDGRSVLVSTFNCGLYLLSGLDTDSPSGRLVSSFPRKAGTSCAIPVVSGRFYVVTVPAWNAVVALDISDPARPREVSRLTLGQSDVPHWISISPDQQRIVVSGYEGMQHRVVIARFDSSSGQLALDERFREPGATSAGYRMDDKTWPHGSRAKGIPHGAVFSRP